MLKSIAIFSILCGNIYASSYVYSVNKNDDIICTGSINRPFMIGSIMDQITAAIVIENMYESLDEPISNLISECNFNKFKDGLSSYDINDMTIELDYKNIKNARVKDLLMHNLHSSGFLFQNFNYDLLGRIIELKFGFEYKEVAKDLFKRAGMDATFFHSDISKSDLSDALGVSEDSDGGVFGENLLDLMNPSGGCISTPCDMIKFAKFLDVTGIHDKMLSYSVEKQNGKRYGLGIAIDGDITAHLGIISIIPQNFCYISYLGQNHDRIVVGFRMIWMEDPKDYNVFFGESLRTHRSLQDCDAVMDLLKDCRARL